MNVEGDHSVPVHERHPLIKPYFRLLPGHTRGISEKAPQLYASFEEQGLIQTDQLKASIPEFSSVIATANPQEKAIVVKELRSELGQNGEDSFSWYLRFAAEYLSGKDRSAKNIANIREFHHALWIHVNNVQAVSLCDQFNLDELNFILEGIDPESFLAHVSVLEAADAAIQHFIPLSNLPDNPSKNI